MKDKSNRIDPNRLSTLMDSGRGKYKDRLQIRATGKSSDVTSDPYKIFEKMKEGRRWLNTELYAVTGIDRQTIGKMRKEGYYDHIKGGSTPDTINKIAEALDVDPEYLTGAQIVMKKKKLTPEEEEKRKKIFEDLDKSRNLRILKDFLKIFCVHIKLDNEEHPTKYWLYDANDDLIRDGVSIDDLNGLITIMFNYLNTGSDIIQLFFGEIWTSSF